MTIMALFALIITVSTISITAAFVLRYYEDVEADAVATAVEPQHEELPEIELFWYIYDQQFSLRYIPSDYFGNHWVLRENGVGHEITSLEAEAKIREVEAAKEMRLIEGGEWQIVRRYTIDFLGMEKPPQIKAPKRGDFYTGICDSPIIDPESYAFVIPEDKVVHCEVISEFAWDSFTEAVNSGKHPVWIKEPTQVCRYKSWDEKELEWLLSQDFEIGVPDGTQWRWENSILPF